MRNDNEIRDLISGMGGQLEDDACFLAGLERKLDSVELARKRNKQMARDARRRLLRTILCGLGMAALILLVVFNCTVLSFYTIAYTVILSVLSMLSLLVVSIALQ